MPRHFDHIDLRVKKLAEVTAFYAALLPALGFSRQVAVEGWFQFETDEDGVREFFGITESPSHVPNEIRVAFRAESRDAVDRIAGLARVSGAQNMEGPMDYEAGYYAAFFEDPSGNRLEICHRTQSAPAASEAARQISG